MKILCIGDPDSGVVYHRIYTDHYGRKYGWPVSDEVRAKIWNGGPTGPNKPQTEKYWQKVKAKL